MRASLCHLVLPARCWWSCNGYLVLVFRLLLCPLYCIIQSVRHLCDLYTTDKTSRGTCVGLSNLWRHVLCREARVS